MVQLVVVSQEQDSFFLLEMVAEAPQHEDDKNAIKERKVLKRSSSLSRVEDNLRMKRTFFLKKVRRGPVVSKGIMSAL